MQLELVQGSQILQLIRQQAAPARKQLLFELVHLELGDVTSFLHGPGQGQELFQLGDVVLVDLHLSGLKQGGEVARHRRREGCLQGDAARAAGIHLKTGIAGDWHRADDAGNQT